MLGARRPATSASFALCLVWVISLTIAASSSVAISQNDAECEKSFTRGVELYELGLQVGHLRVFRGAFHLVRQSHRVNASV
jgi:hypothetical protein